MRKRVPPRSEQRPLTRGGALERGMVACVLSGAGMAEGVEKARIKEGVARVRPGLSRGKRAADGMQSARPDSKFRTGIAVEKQGAPRNCPQTIPDGVRTVSRRFSLGSDS